MFICLFVCLFVYISICFFCFNHRRIPKGSFPQNFMMIGLDLAEILRISKLDWRDGGGGEEGKGRNPTLYVFHFNHCRIPKGSFPQNFVKIGLDLAEILRIRKLDWRDGGGEEGKGRNPTL